MALRLTELHPHKSRVRRVFTDGSYRPSARSVIVNWGNSRAPQNWNNGLGTVLNHWDRVAIATNKLRCFQALSEGGTDGFNIPRFTTDIAVARGWLHAGASAVVSRTILNGHSGHGIELAEKAEEIVEAPLYVEYVKKKKEFRVHVCLGKVIDIQEKRLRRDFEGDKNSKVRNLSNGWIYAREQIQEPATLRTSALAVIAKLGLDFGAVDIIYNGKQDCCYVLEVNTAPGLEGTTVEKYAEGFKEKLV